MIKMSDILMIIAQRGFQPIEYKDTKEELQKGGFKVITASVTTNDAIGKDGTRVKPDIAVKDSEVDDYDAVVVIGGPGALSLGEHKEIIDLLNDANDKGKIIAAICIAPVILAENGLLHGKKATVWNGDGEQEEILRNNGAEFVNEAVVQDGRIITANGPMASKEFGRAIARALR
jgi:protease I